MSVLRRLVSPGEDRGGLPTLETQMIHERSVGNPTLQLRHDEIGIEIQLPLHDGAFTTDISYKTCKVCSLLQITIAVKSIMVLGDKM